MKNFTRWLVSRVTIPTSRGNSHLMWQFSSHVAILISRGNSHLACIFLPHVLPSTTQSHLVSTLSTHSHLTWHLSSRVAILISHGNSHLTWIFLPNMLPTTQNNIFPPHVENSQKCHAATPIPSVRYLLQATNQFLMDWLETFTK